MIRTALLCAALALGGYASAAWLTHDFQAWTAEGARRLEVALAPVPTPAVRSKARTSRHNPCRTCWPDGQSVTVVDFFYTRCQTVCLSLGGVFQQMQAALQAAGDSDAAAARVRLLSISFDERDSTQDLRTYAARLHADPHRWRFASVRERR